MNDLLISAEKIMDCLNDGVYVCVTATDGLCIGTNLQSESPVGDLRMSWAVHARKASLIT
jgi:hypothetical protein